MAAKATSTSTSGRAAEVAEDPAAWAMSDARVEEAARLFGMLGEPARLFLLRALMDGPRNVGELVALTGMKQGNVSKHLGILLATRFVRRERRGNFAVYEIADAFVHELCDLMCRRIESDSRARAAALR